MGIKNILKSAVYTLFRRQGYDIVKLGDSTPRLSFIPISKTLAAARKAGLSVGDYIDSTSNVPGATLQTIERMTSLPVMKREFQRVCEIGPGSGRYLEKIQKLYHPAYYEIYEIEPDWSKWLVENFQVKAQPCDGKSMAGSPNKSVDLIHANKVFTCIPIMASLQYFCEMARVISDNGIIIFDIIDENCLTNSLLEKWFQIGYYYPVMLAKQFVIDYFRSYGVHYCDSFFAQTGPGISEYLVFSRAAAPLKSDEGA